MGHDPFVRGPFPVRTQSGHAVDARRGDRQLPFEVWYPETRPQSDESHPLVLYSHSSYGQRRQSSFLSTHLASQGYIVAAADHTGNTVADWAAPGAPAVVRTPEQREASLRRIIGDRVPDLRFLLDELLGGAVPDVAERIDERRIGLCGWSFGGWAVLSALEADERFASVVAMAPAGSSKPLPGIIPAALTFAWKRDVPALYLAAERDRFTPLEGVRELFERTRSPKTMFILRGADHGHFADDVDPTGPSAEQAHVFTRGLALAHLDATLKEDPAARRFIDDDPLAALRARGVDATLGPDGVAGTEPVC